jgi:hypothetical protein
MLPLRALPFWPKKKRLTDTYLSDQHVTAFALPAGDAERVAELEAAVADR